jgi:hypothetical protein
MASLSASGVVPREEAKLACGLAALRLNSKLTTRADRHYSLNCRREANFFDISVMADVRSRHIYHSTKSMPWGER